jgi:hypothetical protein
MVPVTSAHEKVPAYIMGISVSPSSTLPVKLPPEYADFADVSINLTRENLPEHSKFDLKIKLQDPSNFPSPQASYNLLLSKKQALKAYIDDTLSKGWIHSLKSPCAAGIFFIKKKDGGL